MSLSCLNLNELELLIVTNNYYETIRKTGVEGLLHLVASAWRSNFRISKMRNTSIFLDI